MFIVILLLAAGFYPLTLAAEFNRQELNVYWRPLPLLKARIRLLHTPLLSAEVLALMAEGDWLGLGKRALASKKKKKPTGKRRRLAGSISGLISGVLSVLHIRRFRLHIALGGDPAAAAMLLGGLWGALAAGLGWLSFRVAAWPVQRDNETLTMELLPFGKGISDSQIDFAAELMLRPWALAAAVIKALCAPRQANSGAKG